MKKVVAKLTLAALIATVVAPAHAEFSLKKGVKESAYLATGISSSLLALFLLAGINDIRHANNGGSISYTPEDIKKIGTNNIGLGVAGITALAGSIIYNGFSK